MPENEANDSVAKGSNMKGECIAFQVLGIVLWGLLSVSVTFGEVAKASSHVNSKDESVQHIQYKPDSGKWRDPFQPIRKRGVIVPPARKAIPKVPIINSIRPKKNPSWKLLGIIRGKYGRQAVIQLSPQKRIVVAPGLEVARSGWIIKAIRPREILLEYSPSQTAKNGRPQPQVFVLSFSTPQPSF